LHIFFIQQKRTNIKLNSNYKYFLKEAANNNSLSEENSSDNNYHAFRETEFITADATLNGSNSKNESLPFIFQITNFTSSDISNVLLLGANQNLVGVANYGNPALSRVPGNLYSIGITMGGGNVTYAELLFQTTGRPFKVCKMYLHASSGQQAITPFILQHKEATGKLCQDPIVPTLDPYQNKNRTLVMNADFTVDGNTMLTIGTIYALSTLNVYMYPCEDVNMSRSLLGSNVEQKTVAPNIIQGQTLNISAQALKAISQK
jgi:hypothetical protein